MRLWKPRWKRHDPIPSTSSSRISFKWSKWTPLCLLAFLCVGFLLPLTGESQPSPNAYQSFPYASNYPDFAYTTGTATLTPNWNVFSPAANINIWSMVLEPLAFADYLTGKLTPWLASNWTFSQGNSVLTVNLRQGVYFFYNGTWINGSHATILWPFTARDVVVTFQDYFRVYGNPYGVNVTEVSPYQVQFTFQRPNVQYVYYVILVQPIVPWEQYSNMTNPVSTPVQVLVGTGPFYLSSFTSTQATLLRNPYYWIPGRPLIPKMTFYVAVSNAVAFSLLAKGQAMWGGSGSTGSTPFSKLFTYADPQYYHGMASIGNGSGGQVNVLYVNYMHLNYWPWNQSWFRYALSLALNKTQISIQAQFGDPNGGPPMPSDYLPSPMEGIWINSSIIQQAHAVEQYNVSQALQILESHGLKLINGRLSFPNGTPLPSVVMIMYSGFADVASETEAISEEWSAIGLATVVESVTPVVRAQYAQTGQFDLEWYPSSQYSPYNIWGILFIPPLIPGTDEPNITLMFSGKPIYSDYGRWIPPKQFIDLWFQAANTTNVTKLKQIYSAMAAMLVKEIPAIPVTFEAYPRYQYEDQYYVGFVTPQYFYTSDVEPYVEGDIMMVLNIAPRPPGMTQDMEVAYTKAAFNALMAFINGTSNTATPMSLIQMLLSSSSTSSTTSSTTTTSFTTTSTTTTSTTTTTSVTSTTSTTPPTTTSTSVTSTPSSTSTTSRSSGNIILISVAVVVIIIIVIVLLAFLLRSRGAR